MNTLDTLNHKLLAIEVQYEKLADKVERDYDAYEELYGTLAERGDEHIHNSSFNKLNCGCPLHTAEVLWEKSLKARNNKYKKLECIRQFMSENITNEKTDAKKDKKEAAKLAKRKATYEALHKEFGIK